MGASETKLNQIRDDVVSSENYIGKTLTVLSNMSVPDQGQGVNSHGLKIVYFEKKYIVVGYMHIDLKHCKHNMYLSNLLNKLDVQCESDAPSYQKTFVLCDKTDQGKKLPDPDYIVTMGSMKIITDKKMETYLSKSHCTII